MRILAWVVLLLVAAGGVALLVQRRVLLQSLDAEVNDGLVQEAEEMRVLAAGRNPETGRPFEGDAAAIFDTFLRRNIQHEGEALVTFVGGRIYKATAAEFRLDQQPTLTERWSNLTSTDRGEIETPVGPVRYLAVPLESAGRTQGVFVVANFMGEARERINRTTQVGAAVYGSVLVLAIGVAWLIAGKVLAPVRLVTATAKNLTGSDLSSRIPVPDSKDEVAELARTFNSMLDRLETAFVHQRDFLNDAGHELRTPITIVRGHLELAGDDPVEREATRSLVFDELDRMARIVEDLLILARSERPDFLRLEPVDLDLLTTELLAKARGLAACEWRLAATGHGVFNADRHRLTQAVVNLLDNASRHCGPNRVVELGSEMSAGAVRIWVRDDGPGIPQAEQADVFRRFARSSAGGRAAGSAGLGLAIVKAVAEAHGGSVQIDSAEGRGSTFTITVPTGG